MDFLVDSHLDIDLLSRIRASDSGLGGLFVGFGWLEVPRRAWRSSPCFSMQPSYRIRSRCASKNTFRTHCVQSWVHYLSHLNEQLAYSPLSLSLLLLLSLSLSPCSYYWRESETSSEVQDLLNQLCPPLQQLAAQELHLDLIRKSAFLRRRSPEFRTALLAKCIECCLVSFHCLCAYQSFFCFAFDTLFLVSLLDSFLLLSFDLCMHCL